MTIETPWKRAAVGAADAPLLAGVELGGTKIILTLGSGPDAVLASERIPTGMAARTLERVETILDAWITAHPAIAAIGVASFGPLELDRASPAYGSITRTTKTAWSGTDIVGRLRRRYGLPLGFDTDVNGAALAEGRWGAARSLRSWVYITIGTGVGAGIVVDGRTISGLGHSEAGHMLVRSPPGDTFPGICAFHGDCIEGLVSGPAIAARTGLKGEDIPDDHPVWSAIATTIAAMIHNLTMTVAPQRVILGGGVIERRRALFGEIRRTLVDTLGAYAHTPDIARDVSAFVVPPALGAMAGPLGALALASDACPVPADG